MIPFERKLMGKSVKYTSVSHHFNFMINILNLSKTLFLVSSTHKYYYGKKNGFKNNTKFWFVWKITSKVDTKECWCLFLVLNLMAKSSSSCIAINKQIITINRVSVCGFPESQRRYIQILMQLISQQVKR